ncbi:InlB B-repeat-containing protein, partial [Butyrivibrio sp. WCE2006]|uniref:InlB B-repeat-containing protein n=1 Tax=Butyrivibrio sp. WCE2006 TaxID=1410611 RepID=UPI0018CC0EEA
MSMAVSAESLSGSISVSSLKVNDVLTYGITNITDISEYTVTLQGNRHYLFNNVVTNDTVLTDFTIFYDNSSSYGGVEFRPTGQSQGWYIPYDGTDITTEWLVVAVDHSQKTLTLAGVPDHTHNITYSASGATITAICNDTSCELHNSPATLTLSAADASYSGSAYAGASLTDTTAWTGAGLTAPTIEYEGRGNTSYTKSETAPANAGTYTASITVDTDKTATVDFTISKAAPGTPTVTMSDYTYSGTVSTPSIGTYSGEGAVTYYYSTTNSASGGTAWENITATTLEAKTYYMYAVIAESDNYNSYTTATTSFTISKADQTAPDAPTKASATASSITLTEITNGEYKRNNGEWQTSPTFTGLEMNTPYTFYQRLKEDDNHNASPASQSAEISTPNHTHNWSYQASGDTITATCGNDDGEHGTPLTATLTINAPTLIYVGQTGDGISAQASITDENSIKGDAVISYFNANEAGTAKDGSALSSAPTDAGKYWAEITLGTGGNTATAHVVYSIGYAVTFNTNGGSEVPMQVVRKGESATRPAAPTKAGNIFGDWYADSEYNETYRFGSSVNTNTTVHAKWGTHEVEWVFYTGSIASYSIRDVFSGTAPAVDSISDVIVSMLDETRPAATTVVGWKTETDASGNVTYYRVLMKSPTAKSLTYTGSAQELVNAGVVYGSEMQYALGTDDQTAPTQDWTTDIPTGNEAKTYFVWYKAIGDSGFSDSAAACIKVTISNPYTPPVKPKPTTDTEEYTIPVENNNTVDVGAEIQSGTAVINEITEEDLSKVTSNDNTGGNGNTPGSGAGDNSQIVIDLSGAKQEVVACELTKQSLERLADTAESNSNQVDSVKIQMTNATVELDGKALNAIADQATGSSIKLVVEDTQQTKLNQAQQNALSKYSSVTSFEAYFESNGARIHNFKGGKATVS